MNFCIFLLSIPLCWAHIVLAAEFYHLEKRTVGPEDNYQTSLAEEGDFYFTKNTVQSTAIYRFSAKTQLETLMTAEYTDAKDPAYNIENKTLAYIDYLNAPRGRVCLLKNGQRRCFGDQKIQHQTPFWIDSDHLGYLRRTWAQSSNELWVYDLSSGSHSKLFQGNITQPAVHPISRNIVFVQHSESGSELVEFDGKKQKIIAINQIGLPGVSGYLSFSEDGQWLYLSHYLGDANQDQRIDGEDKSVLLRIDWNLRGNEQSKKVSVLQLTSLIDNCNFPSYQKDGVYLTCARGKTLDIYRLPLDSQTLFSKDQEQLWSSYRAARSYEDRLLVLSHLDYRYPDLKESNQLRRLTHYLHIQDWVSSLELLKELSGLDGELYPILIELLETKQLLSKQENRLVDADLRKKIELLSHQYEAGSSGIIKALKIQLELAQYNGIAAKALLEDYIERLEKFKPLENYLLLNFAQQLLGAVDLSKIYEQIIQKAKLDSQSMLFYGYQYCLGLQGYFGVKGRIDALERMSESSIDSKVKLLFEGELLAHAYAKEEDSKLARKILYQLKGLIRGQESYVHRLVHLRIVEVLNEHKAYSKALTFSTSWLNSTKESEPEFRHALEQYLYWTLEKAYKHLGREELKQAHKFFYWAARQTDSLQAHYELFQLNQKQGKDLDVLHKKILDYGYAKESRNYLDALLPLLQFESQQSLSHAQESLLKAIPVRPEYALHYELLAYTYHKQLILSKKGYTYNKDLLKQAHRYYLIGLDLAGENERLRSQIYMNMGWLHFQTRGFGLASDYWSKRGELAFLNQRDKFELEYLLSRSLYYGGNSKAALKSSLSAYESCKILSDDCLQYQQLAAFMLLQNEQFDEAAKQYRLLMEQNGVELEKAYLVLAYGAYKQEKWEEVVEYSTLGLNEKSKLYDQFDFVDRRRILLLGFLSKSLFKLGKLEESYSSLKERIQLFRSIKEMSDDLPIDENQYMQTLIKDYTQLSSLAWKLGMNLEAIAAQLDALELAVKLWEKNEAPYQPIVLNTLRNSAILEKLNGTSSSRLAEIQQHWLEAIEAAPPGDEYERAGKEQVIESILF